ncbi:hypothetical protein [Massilia pseudoviolaceinigra]|uniref:hypothetical protein n=1 Tax=Massilia pseudoviolaceinigra TaxID=3057165 RepID=UPI00279662FD|nr:hypothetical protein [Massilia sp. CCM 9206]MDQ1922305.1 hypothetical protein [Massilia sp. CCM 9206]
MLVAVNAQGGEPSPDPDWPQGPISARAIQTVVEDGITDVFLWSHGWKGAVRDAVDQYDRWIGAFAARSADRAQMLQRQPGFKEMHIGFHWPSLAWGNEALAPGASFAPGSGASVQSLEDHYASELGDTPAVRAALHKLFADLRTNCAEYDLTDAAREAYLELDQALALGDGGAPGDGAADRAKFDPDQALVDDDNVAFGGGALASRLLAPLRQLTFWTMKKRAKTVGEDGLHPLLVKLQQSAPALRIHLMGHSFGCIVMSSAVLGRQAGAALVRPIDSCVLVQGATSLWAFARSNPLQSDVPGYFSNILANKLVRGPLVCTQSKYDYAVGKIYPWAAGVANQVSFGLPQFGAIGTHGICGIADGKALFMHAQADAYQFAPGCVYNVDGSQYIRKLDGLSGAHSDIAGPEVAHLIWQAAMSAQEAA